MISFCIIHFYREEYLLKLVKSLSLISESEIIIFDNGSDNLEKQLMSFQDVTYLKSKKNIGVVGARKELIKIAKNDYLIFLDDDIAIKDEAIFEINLKSSISSNPNSIITFKVTRPDGSMRNEEIISRANEKKEVAMFLGGACVFPKSMALYYLDLHLLNNLYGMEEYEFILSTANKKFSYIYDPSIEVIHHKVSSGIKSNHRFSSSLHKIKMKLNLIIEFYPLPFALIAASLWIIKAMLEGRKRKIPINHFIGLVKNGYKFWK